MPDSALVALSVLRDESAEVTAKIQAILDQIALLQQDLAPLQSKDDAIQAKLQAQTLALYQANVFTVDEICVASGMARSTLYHRAGRAGMTQSRQAQDHG